MNITIVGGHGQIAMLLYPILKERGHDIRGLIRNENQKSDLRDAGVVPVLCDVEEQEDISETVGDADLVLFAAGAGPGSGAERKWTVDRDGAIKLMEAAKKKGIQRYIMISAMGAEEPITHENEVFATYLKAKAAADDALRKSGLDYTIVKPGRLTNDEGTGKVEVGSNVGHKEIPRQDVAHVLASAIEMPELNNSEFEVIGGQQPIDKALKTLAK